MRTARFLSRQFFLVTAVLCNAAAHSYDGSGIAAGLSNHLPSNQTCESRTVNYITHTLPQQCLRTNWSAGNSTAPSNATTPAAAPAATTTSSAEGSTISPSDGAVKEEAKAKTEAVQEEEELETASFMSFEEWKAIQIKKQGQEQAESQAKRRQERKAEVQANKDALEGLGDDGDIAKQFEALNEKVSELAAKAAHTAAEPRDDGDGTADSKTEVASVIYEDDKTQIHRSKEAGTTSKERFSFASFDAGATIKKTSHGAKNAKSILVENKDSYMLLTCGSENKFVIIELSEDILVDTVVLANFEFFSSMIRRFRVSVSARYPVKIDKWTDIGTYEARNSRDIQPFLIEHPGTWAKYIRIEFLTHYGNEYYCPVSLLRVHGIRMMEPWQEGEEGHDDDDEEVLDLPASDHVTESETTAVPDPATAAAEQSTTSEPAVTAKEVGLSPWQPIFFGNASNVCYTLWEDDTTTETSAQETTTAEQPDHAATPVPGDTPATTTAAAQAEYVSTGASGSTNSSAAKSSAASSHSYGQPAANASLADPAQRRYEAGNGTSEETQPEQGGPAAKPSPADPPPPKANEKPQVVEKPAEKQKAQPPPPPNSKPSSRTSQSQYSASSQSTKPNSNSSSSNKSRTATSASSSPSSSPPVQESFFKSVSKRLQLLEANTTLSLQYIEDQSLFLRDALAKMERRQVARIDSFLGALNGTVLAELHTLRGQYDQLWQSTILALESQRSQYEREVLALSTRLSLLADEVVFQKRMAILQSCLLLACLVLVIFSRNGLLTGTPAGVIMYPSGSSPGGGPSSPPLSARYAASPSNSPLRNGNNNGVRRSYVPRMTQMDPDKTLPLTPTSEFDSAEVGSPPATAPAIRVDSPGQGSAGFDSSGDAGLPTPKSMLSRESSLSLDDDSLHATPTPSDTTMPQDTVVEDAADIGLGKENQVEAMQPEPLSTPRSAVAQRNGARKPLPALPEHPV